MIHEYTFCIQAQGSSRLYDVLTDNKLPLYSMSFNNILIYGHRHAPFPFVLGQQTLETS